MASITLVIIISSISIYLLFLVIGLFGIAENKRAQGLDPNASELNSTDKDSK